jgi:hypothetical protein
LFKLDEERRTKKFSATPKSKKKKKKKTKIRKFLWPMPISVPIDGYTGLFI